MTRIRLVRWLGMVGGTGWVLYGRVADGSLMAGETCTTQPGQDHCDVGGYSSSELDRAVNTSSIAYGFECPTTGAGCVTGGTTIHYAGAAIYSARVTISDPTPPTVGTPSGVLVTDVGYHKGVESVSFAGSDALGLSGLRVYVGGQLRGSVGLGCDYTRVVPCSNPAQPVLVNADLSGVPDGRQVVQVAAVDEAGNETRAVGQAISVDQTAPAPPVGLAAVGRAESDPGFSASWAVPGGQVAPVVAAHWTLCQVPASSACQSGTVSGSSLTGSLPAQGNWTLGVALEDGAGNTGAAASLPLRYAQVSPTPSPTPTPTPTPTPAPRADPKLRVSSATLKRASRRLSVSGTATRALTGRVTVRVSIRRGSRVKTRAATATVKRGRYRATLRLGPTEAKVKRLIVSVSFSATAKYKAAAVQRGVKVR